jgi:hypothetical protein
MNLTGRPVYQKGQKRKSRAAARAPNAEERRHWDRVGKLPCMVGPVNCRGRITIHHTGTGGGGRKNHMKVLPICEHHHLGDEGIDSLAGKMSRREWEERFGTEAELLEKLENIMGMV